MAEEEIVQEYSLLELAATKTIEKGTFRELFWKNNIRQTFIVLGINFFLQTTGFTFHIVYGSVYIRSLGTVNPFNINLIKSFISLAVGIGAMWASDIVGRRLVSHFLNSFDILTQRARHLLLIGGSIQAVALFSMATVGVVAPTSSAKNSAIVSMMILFVVGWTLGWSPNSHILSAEIPNQRLRDMSYRTGSAVNVLMQ